MHEYKWEFKQLPNEFKKEKETRTFKYSTKVEKYWYSSDKFRTWGWTSPVGADPFPRRKVFPNISSCLSMKEDLLRVTNNTNYNW